MRKIVLMVPLLIIQATTFAEGQLSLSKVNTGDCVAPRITAKRTNFVDELDKIYCAKNNPDKAKERKCMENSRSQKEFSFFTDRCSADKYFIGINGKEFQLRRISKEPRKTPYFIGSFAGEGVRVEISHPRLIKKTYILGETRNEDNVQDAEYKVLVTVKKGTLKKTFKGTLWYGR